MQSKWFPWTVAGVCLPLVASLALVGCPSNNDDKAAEGEGCSVDADCQSGLLCRAEICTKPTTVDPDMSNGDMGDMGGDMNNNNGNVDPEDYIVSFIRKSEVGADKDKNFMFVLDTTDNTTTQVTTDGNLCQVKCWLTRDLKTFVYMRQSSQTPGTFDIYTTGVDSGYKVTSSGTVLIDGAERVDVRGNLVYFVKDEGGNKKAYYLPATGTMPKLIADLGPAAATQGSAVIDEVSNKVVVYKPTLQELDISIGELGGDVQSVYTIDAKNYQEVGGSYFGATIPTAFSPDGKYMALLTTAPNNYNTCESDGDCTGVGQHCGEQKLCTAREVTVRFFDLANLDKLGQTCDTDAKCGGVHQCYIPSTSALDKAKCMPRRIPVGLPNTPEQPRTSPNKAEGCVNTAGNTTLFYTDLTAPMSFDNNGNLYVVGQRKCGGRNGEINISDADILRFGPKSTTYEVVYGNPGKDFSGNLCYDDTENRIDIKECIVYIESARLSPNGQELTFMGTNPNTQDPTKTNVSLDIWSVLRNGKDHEWNGQSGLFDRVQDFWVHPKP